MDLGKDILGLISGIGKNWAWRGVSKYFYSRFPLNTQDELALSIFYMINRPVGLKYHRCPVLLDRPFNDHVRCANRSWVTIPTLKPSTEEPADYRFDPGCAYHTPEYIYFQSTEYGVDRAYAWDRRIKSTLAYDIRGTLLPSNNWLVTVLNRDREDLLTFWKPTLPKWKIGVQQNIMIDVDQPPGEVAGFYFYRGNIIDLKAKAALNNFNGASCLSFDNGQVYFCKRKTWFRANVRQYLARFNP